LIRKKNKIPPTIWQHTIRNTTAIKGNNGKSSVLRVDTIHIIFCTEGHGSEGKYWW